MKKGWLLTIVAGTLALGVAVGSAATSMRKQIEVDYSGIKINVDGRTVDTANSEPFAVVSESRTYVPARYLAEALGAKVGWDQATNTVLVYTEDYVTKRTDGGTTTFNLPYHGVTLLVPSGGMSVVGGPNLVEVSAGGAAVMLNRMNYDYNLGMTTVTNVAINSLKTVMPLEVTGVQPISVPGAVAARDVSGVVESTQVRIRLMAEGSNLWMLMVVGNPESPLSEAEFSSLLNGLKLPQE